MRDVTTDYLKKPAYTNLLYDISGTRYLYQMIKISSTSSILPPSVGKMEEVLEQVVFYIAVPDSSDIFSILSETELHGK